MQYLNFDIRISATENDGYVVQAVSEEFGEAEGLSALDTDAPEILEALRRLDKRLTDRRYLESVGSELYQKLFVEDVEAIFQRSFGQVQSDSEQGLLIRLRITAPEVAALPWELLFSNLDQQFIATRIKSPVIRYLEFPGYKRYLATPFPLRLLVVIPRGSGSTTTLDVDSEKAVIEHAFEGLEDRVEVTYLNELFSDRRVTWQRISEQLSTKDYHCFHFIGHGTFINDHGHLVLDGENGEDDVVADIRFAEMFRNTPSVKLVVLNACKGAVSSSSQSLSGSASQLVKHGVPAVVAMQFNIYDKAAVKYSQSFYHSLFQSGERGRVDVAITRGRHRLEIDFRDELEMAAPVLFMHTSDGLLFVPESVNYFENLPKSKAEMHTLLAAQQATESASEEARFRHRITVAKRSVQVGLLVSTFAFFLSWIQILDIFTIDTRAEFIVMGLGNRLTDHQLSDELRIVTIKQPSKTSELREKVASVIGGLSGAGADTIALDMYYSEENGEFKYDPPSGKLLVDAIEAAESSIIVGAKERKDGNARLPSSLFNVVSGIGHLCYESKLQLTRSLPISIARSEGRYPSLALSAYSSFLGGKVVDSKTGNESVVIAFPDKPSKSIAISDIGNHTLPDECQFFKEGDRIYHRFIKITPKKDLNRITMSATDLENLASENLQIMQKIYQGRLVLIGVLGAGDIINDLGGNREGVFWHADAINNLLQDEEIVPLSNAAQLALMLILAGIAASLRLQSGKRSSICLRIMFFISIVVVLLAVYTYSRFGILINPAYHILALWFSWWLAGGKRKLWLS